MKLYTLFKINSLAFPRIFLGTYIYVWMWKKFGTNASAQVGFITFQGLKNLWNVFTDFEKRRKANKIYTLRFFEGQNWIKDVFIGQTTPSVFFVKNGQKG